MNADQQEFIEALREVMRSPGDKFHMRTATVTAVNRTTNKYSISQGGTTLTNIPALSGIWPMVGDVVDVVYDDTSPRIVGVVSAIEWITVGSGSGPSFQNGWVQEFDRPLSFARDSMGFVHLRGKFRNGATNSVVFTLPSGYRPLSAEDFVMFSNGAAYQAKVDAFGQAWAYTPAAPPWATFSGITFLADGS